MPGTGTGAVTRPERAGNGSIVTPASLRVQGLGPRSARVASDRSRIGFFTNFTDGKPLIEGSDVGHDIANSWDATAAGVAAKAIGQGMTQLLLAGTNMTDALATWAAGGGLTLTTATADNDSAYMIPNSDSDVANAFTELTWDFDRQPYFLSEFATGSAVTTTAFFQGFKIDNDFGTDDVDIAGFFIDSEVEGNIQLVATRNSTGLFPSNAYNGSSQLVLWDSGVALEASTVYSLEIAVDSNGRVVWWINDNEYSGDQIGSEMYLSTGLRGGTSGVHPFWGHTCTAGSAARALTYRTIGASEVYE